MPSPRPRLRLTEAVRHVQRRSFPQHGDDLVGLELEWLVRSRRSHGGPSLDLSRLSGLVLPSHSTFSIEPGGQLELSSAPRASIRTLCAEVGLDVAALREQAALGDVRLVGMGLVPDGPTPRVVCTPRYDAMAAFFAPDGDAGSTMMTATASLQINVGVGDETDRQTRWRRANLLGPVLAGAFANSPLRDGAPTGWASNRLAVWSAIDRSRTAPAWDPARGCESWAAYVMDARVMFIRRAEADFVPVLEDLRFGGWLSHGHELGYPTADDLDYHLTTLFPPVRPKGWLELRFLDALPAPWWQVATAVASCLLRNAEAGARAERAAAPFAGSWRLAARRGLADPGLASAARECFAAAAETMAEVGTDLSDAVDDYVERFVARGRTPSDARLDAWVATGSALLPEDTYRLGVMA